MIKPGIKDEFGASHVPIVADFDFGHTDPKFICLLGQWWK
ncbi:hypothetical protein [Paenibacillus harenae]